MIRAIGTKIKALRIQKNISQEALCGEYLSRVSLSKIENNKMLPSIPQIMYISEKLNVPVTTFLYEQIYENCSNIHQVEDSILKKMFDNKDYYNIVKYYEFEFEEFKNLNDVNKNYYLGVSLFELDMYGQSLKTLKKYISEYLRFSKEYQDRNVILFAYALNSLFRIMLRNSNYEKGEHYLVLAKKYLHRYKKDTYLINFTIHGNLAYILLELSKCDKAIKLIEESFILEYNFVPIYIVANIHLCLNIAYYNVGDYEKSIENIKKSIWLFSYLGQTNLVGGCYLNYINALRYSGNYSEAFEILNKYKNDFCTDAILNTKFKMQEIVLYFNAKEFSRAFELIKSIKLNLIQGITRSNYYFMLGHIEFLNNNYEKARKYLLKCENGFLKQKYVFDLNLVYEDLHKITNDEIYNEKLYQLKHMTGRKNIIA